MRNWRQYLGAALLGGSGALYILLGGSDLLKQQGGVLAWKIVMVSVAVSIAHLLRKQLFSYVDLSEFLRDKTQASATVFLAMAVFYAAVILALCSGL